MAAKKGCLGGCLTTIIVIVVIVAVGVIVLMNLTPNQIGLGDFVISGSKTEDTSDDVSLNSLGFGETKFKDFVSAWRSLSNDDAKIKETVVTNPLTEQDILDAASVFGDSVDLSTYSGGKITTATAQEAELNDTTVGYVLDKAVDNIITASDFAETDFEIISFSLKGVADTTDVKCETVVAVELDDLLEQLGGTIKATLTTLGLAKNDYIYVTVYFDLTLDTTAKQLNPKTDSVTTYKLNGSDELTTILNTAIDNALEEGEDPLGEILTGLDQGICTAINNIGLINSVSPEGKVNITTHTA